MSPEPNSKRPEDFLQLIRRSARGKLKVYLGYCPGVGKTYRMLQEAHRLKTDGVDVVVGVVETHGRSGTAALVSGLEIIPPRVQEYKGIRLEEMDLEAVLARRPAVVVVDEWAHTNAPGSGNDKRWEDVEQILSQGIHVITTVNVQHIESLYDMVSSLVGVKVRERLPDAVLQGADQVVNVDISEQDLLRRLQEGDIYPIDRVETARARYFLPEKLERLRELALRELAGHLDTRRRTAPTSEATGGDAVAVAISAHRSTDARLLRHASRLAGRLSHQWYAVHVEDEDPLNWPAETQRALSEALTLASQLGASVFTLKGEDIADSLLRFAKDYGVGHLVVGRPRPLSFWHRLFRPGVVASLLKRVRGLSIDVVDLGVPEAKTNSASNEPTLPAGTSELLGGASFFRWEEPTAKEEVLRVLVESLYPDDPLRSWEALEIIQARERQGTTFIVEGTILPHGRMAELDAPLLAVGVIKGGVIGEVSESPIELVLLLLTPLRDPSGHVRQLANLARFLRDRETRRGLLRVGTAEGLRSFMGPIQTE